MNQVAPGFEVTMHFWVEECNTGRTLVEPHQATYKVQPPIWCQDDRVELEMHLDHLAKLQFLYHLRRNIADPKYAALQGHTSYMVRAFMESYKRPSDNQRVEFPEQNLRAS